MNWFSFFKPPKKLTVSEWADKYRMLSSESSAEAGKWKTSRAEYQRGIMDAFSDPKIHTVVWMSSAQVGKTSVLENIIGYFITYDPSPILVLQPTLEMAHTFSKDRLAPMIRDTKILSEILPDFKSKKSGNTILHKQFAGGHLTIAGANSPASLASRPIRIVLADEVDRYPASAGSEGDPLSLAFKRTTTFWNKKRLVVSTPTIKGASRIELAYEESDKRKFYVPCNECGHFQVLKMANVDWEKNNPKTARYFCEKCGSAWSDAQRWQNIKNGKWIAEKECNGVAGFWLNEIYSSWVKLEEFVANFLEAKKNPETLKTFVNTSLGETWDEYMFEEDFEWQKLLNRREEYKKIPKKAVVLVCGVDVQDNRLEGEIRAFGENEESWGIKRFVIYGSPALKSTWKDLDNIIFDEYDREDGIKLRVSCTCIDSGGHFADEVYKYCKERELRRVFAIKGASQAGKPIVSNPTKNNKYKALLFSIGTDTAKELIYTRLKFTDSETGLYHWNKEYDEEYFKQLTAEKPIITYKKGVAVREWKKTRARNEALDYNVYLLAALKILNPNFKRLKQAILGDKKKKKSNSKKGWVSGWK